MTVSLFIRSQTTDFDAWLNPDADGLAHFLTEKGVNAYSIHRNPADRNSIIIEPQIADEATATSYAEWFE